MSLRCPLVAKCGIKQKQMCEFLVDSLGIMCKLELLIFCSSYWASVFTSFEGKLLYIKGF